MSTASHSAVLIAVMSAVTVLLRALPFLVFRKKVPAFVRYLGRVLPPAIIGMLVIYCLKDTVITRSPFGAPELIAGALVISVFRTIIVFSMNSFSRLSGFVFAIGRAAASGARAAAEEPRFFAPFRGLPPRPARPPAAVLRGFTG